MQVSRAPAETSLPSRILQALVLEFYSPSSRILRRSGGHALSSIGACPFRGVNQTDKRNSSLSESDGIELSLIGLSYRA